MTIKPIWGNNKAVKTADGYYHTSEVPCPWGIKDLEKESCYDGNKKNKCPYFVRYDFEHYKEPVVVCTHEEKKLQQEFCFD